MLLIIFLIPLICFGQRKEFNEIQGKKGIEETINAYTEFLEKYPESKFTEKAIAGRLKACNKWAGYQINYHYKSYKYTVSGKNKYLITKHLNSIKSFMDKCPETDSINSIKQMLKETIWQNTTLDNTQDAYKNFQKLYPNSEYENELLKKIEESAYQKALTADNESGYIEYLKNYPNSDRKNTVDSLLIASKKFALVKAAQKGNLQRVQEIIPNSDTEIKSRALMEAVRGALYTVQTYEYDKNGNITFKTKRKFEVPRETYVEIIKLLIDNGASPKLFSYEEFGSVEDRASTARAASQINKKNTGITVMRTKIGGEINENLVPYRKSGKSVYIILSIHRARDIMEILPEQF